MMIDIADATERMVSLLTSVSEDQFDLPTPCPDARLGDLVDHVGTFATGFTDVAHKEGRGGPTRPSFTNLEAGWRDRITRHLRMCADAWRHPEAWEGTTVAAQVELPAEVAGLVVLDELIVHGWDIAVSTGQPYDASVAEIEAASSFVASFDAPRDGNLFGPVVSVPDSAPPLDRLLGLTGRDPSWRPPA
ncbi:MAG: TIGR03086 family metal-binding protein [Actinomycetota bacterium]|nr:TIGR03086 family metal-binding protein [Actinomycetota bacterium]